MTSPSAKRSLLLSSGVFQPHTPEGPAGACLRRDFLAGGFFSLSLGSGAFFFLATAAIQVAVNMSRAGNQSVSSRENSRVLAPLSTTRSVSPSGSSSVVSVSS